MEKEMNRTRNEAMEAKIDGVKMQKRKKLPGFTLIEIIAVMAIIGVMAGALLPSIQTAMNKSKDAETLNNLAMVDSAAKIYKMETGDNLTTDTWEKTLVDNHYVPKKDYSSIKMEGEAFVATLSDKTTRRSDELGIKNDQGTSSASGTENGGQ